MKSFASWVTRTIPVVLFLVCFALTGSAQTAQSYIYGTVYAKSGQEYEGFMRWGKEEVFWHDIFNSTKTGDQQSNFNHQKKSSSRWFDFDWDLGSIWDNKYGGTAHAFACHFGDINMLELRRNGKVIVGLKNGSSIEVQGGSNDIGTTINMVSPEVGSIKIPWDRIKEIRFSDAPRSASPPYDPMLYGSVQTIRNKTYQGIITWDMDERLTSDVLDGDSRQGEHEIPMGLIRSISRQGDDASEVVMKSGRNLVLDGSNDVDDGNRGIVVFDANYNSIKINWDDFESVTFEEKPGVIPVYADFATPVGISAEVTTFKGDRHAGLIAFDIDELWEMEFLDGNDDEIEYQIPFRNIQRIVPKNRSYSMIYLIDGESLLLGDTQDVSGNNDGILIFKEGQKDPVRVRWDDIDEIVFR